MVNIGLLVFPELGRIVLAYGIDKTVRVNHRNVLCRALMVDHIEVSLYVKLAKANGRSQRHGSSLRQRYQGQYGMDEEWVRDEHTSFCKSPGNAICRRDGAEDLEGS